MIPIFRAKDKALLFSRLEKRKAQISGGVVNAVRRIISDVRKNGDRALVKYNARLDGERMSPGQIRVDPRVLQSAARQARPELILAIEKAMFNIHAYHKREVQKSWEFSRRGVILGQRILPLESVGVYVPGGSAAYPSSVLMNVIPAKIAGVSRIAVATPPGTFQKHPIIAATLQKLGIKEVYLVGGAQAIAALAYGTETIRRVDKIVGPGNAYVAAAKREVFGEVSVDMIAGPSEVAIMATTESNPRFIAADMLSQAEHDALACALCFTDSVPHAILVQRELQTQLDRLPRKAIAGQSLDNFGAIAVVESHLQAAEWINEIAPEHLEILSSVPESVVKLIRNAGAIFYGDYSPEAVGDYFAGSNHVLPTGGTARFFSALGVYDFQRRTSTIRYTPEELSRTWEAIELMALSEGLHAHAWSVRIRNTVEEDPDRQSEVGPS